VRPPPETKIPSRSPKYEYLTYIQSAVDHSFMSSTRKKNVPLH
jgi:hypothetical protein